MTNDDELDKINKILEAVNEIKPNFIAKRPGHLPTKNVVITSSLDGPFIIELSSMGPTPLYRLLNEGGDVLSNSFSLKRIIFKLLEISYSDWLYSVLFDCEEDL